MTTKNEALTKAADHYEERAQELEKFAQRFPHIASFGAKADAFHEAAAYAHQQKD